MLEPSASQLTRRTLWIAISFAGAAAVLWERYVTSADRTSSKSPPDAASGDVIVLADFSDAGARIGTARVRKIVRSESDWWRRLTPQQFYVTRKGSTDEPFSGTFYKIHEVGLYRCICCGTALFGSEQKFDSGTGWPAFTAPLAAENLRSVDRPGVSKEDALYQGVEVLCRRCDAHLGHIFNDGPEPSYLRYCINESAMHFVRRALRNEG